MNEEEIEVLKSIYESDPNFSAVNDTTFQYKVIIDSDNDRFYLIEIQWPEGYPEVIPKINLDLFCNRLLTNDFKIKLREKLTADANDQLGMPMTYTLFESVKEFSYDGDMFQNSLASHAGTALPSTSAATTASSASTTIVKKDQLTKSQKRRQWNTRAGGEDGQKPRGHDWMDIIRHLSQTGNKIDD